MIGTSAPSMASGATCQPVGIGVVGRLAGGALAQEDDVGDDGRALALEGVGGQADRAEEVGRSARYSRMAAFCLSSVKWLVTRASTPPGFRASTDLAKK